MEANLLRFKAIYFANHRKLAVKAIQGNNFRKLKSAFSPVISLGIYKTKFYTVDGIINPEIRPFYDAQASIYEFRAIGSVVVGGFAGKLVIYKNLYISGVGVFSAEPQLRKYHYRDMPRINSINASIGSELRLLLGYNSENFYSGIWLNNSLKGFNGNSLKIGTNLSSIGFSIGYRIDIKKDPAWVQRIKGNKVYSSL